MANKTFKSLTPQGLDTTYKVPATAPEYAATNTYAVGDLAVYQGVLYKCTTAIDTPEAWTVQHWQDTTIGDEVSTLKESISEYASLYTSINRYDGTFDQGYLINQVTGVKQTNTGNSASDYIAVENETNSVVISISSVNTNNYNSLRYALYSDKSESSFIRGALIASGDTDTDNQRYYSVIDVTGAKYIRFSVANVYFLNPLSLLMLAFGNESQRYSIYSVDKWKINGLDAFDSSVTGFKPLTLTAASLDSNRYLIIAGDYSIKKNKVYRFRANIDSSFSSVQCGNGADSYSLYWIIDNTNITFGSNGSTSTQLPHGLTLDTYIDLTVIVNDTKVGKLILNTLNGTYTKEVQIVLGYKGGIFIRPINCTITNVLISFACADFRQPIWMFGDSYFSHTSTNRWTYWLIQWGFARCLMNAFPGERAEEAIVQVQNYIEQCGNPKYIVWCLGMNNPDTSSAVNETWMDCTNHLLEICKRYQITPIFATIPNVPQYSNYYKNEWVRNSGYRYIDFAKAVGAEEVGSSWYTGCLDEDNTHPAEPGARLLCLQALNDVPELMLGNVL